MSQYVDSSALVKRYVDESDSAWLRERLLADPRWVCANHTYTEVFRTLHRVLGIDEFRAARTYFDNDWRRIYVVKLDDTVCVRAAIIAARTGVRSMDALHLGAAERVGVRTFVTFDDRQAAGARALGFRVVPGP